VRKLLIILVCLTALWVVADRRGQIMEQRPPAGGSSPMPPTSTGPGIWVDVIQYVTNSLFDFTAVTNETNYGFMGGWFPNNYGSGNPATNIIYRTIAGGALTGISPTTAGIVWMTNGDITANNQCYFQSNYGTIAIRLNCKNYGLDSALAPLQTGTTGPTGPGPGYVYPHIFSGTIRFDWGQPGIASRLLITPPVGTENTWLNIVYVKSNDLMQCWIAGTNFLESTGHSTDSLFPTNNYAGPLHLLQGLTATNFLTKRILFWRTVLTPLEITNLHTWMTSMP